MRRRDYIDGQQRHAGGHAAIIRPLHQAIRQLVRDGYRDILLTRAGDSSTWFVSSNDKRDPTLCRHPDYHQVAGAFFDAATRALQPGGWNGKVRIVFQTKHNGFGWHVPLIDPVSGQRIEHHFHTTS